MRKIRLDFCRLNRDFEDTAQPTGQKVSASRQRWSVCATGSPVRRILRAEKAYRHRSEGRWRVWKVSFRSATCGSLRCRSSSARKYGLLRQGVRRSLRELCEFLSETRCNMLSIAICSLFFCRNPLLQKFSRSSSLF